MGARMSRCLALVVLAGCSFSSSVGGPNDQLVLDATQSDAPVDAPPDAAVGAEAMPMQMTMTFTSVADVYLRTTVAPDQNTNDLDYVIVDGDNIATALVRFDISAIPTTAVVMSAQLALYDDGDPGQTCSIYPLLESWDEATATSNQRATGMAWLGAGATPPSRSATACGTITPTNANQTYTASLTTAIVQGWVTTPGTNYGVAIATTNSDGPRFGSREKVTASQRPMLSVTFTP